MLFTVDLRVINVTNIFGDQVTLFQTPQATNIKYESINKIRKCYREE